MYHDGFRVTLEALTVVLQGPLNTLQTNAVSFVVLSLPAILSTLKTDL